jgi:integrase
MSKPLTQADIAKLTCSPHLKSLEATVDAIKVPGLFVEIRHTGGMTYYLRYRDSEKRTRYAKIGRTMDISLGDAKKQALKLRAGILLGNYPNADRQEKSRCISWNELFEMYIEFAKPRKRSWRDDEKLHNTRIKERFGHLSLDQISRHAIQQFHGDLKESGLAPATCDHYLGLIIRCFRLAVEWELLEKNPAAGLKKFNVDNSRSIFLSPQELGRLLTVLEHDSARMPCLAVKLMLFSGSRVGETLHTLWEDIDMDAAVWTVRPENSKSRKRRVIPLGTAALDVLRELSNFRRNEWVFINSRNGERLQSIDKVWQRLRVEAGQPTLPLHGTRHHFASTLANEGVDLYRIQKLLGHASPSQTQRYSGLSGSSLQDAANAINGYLDKALNKKGDADQ